MDFASPLHEVWHGYINPHWKPCPEDQKTCFNGSTAGAAWLSAIVRLLCCASEDARDGGRRRERGGLWPHPYLTECRTAPTYECPRDIAKQGNEAFYRWHRERGGVVPPTMDLHELVVKLSGREPSFMGHDSIDNWSVVKKILEAAGLPESWGTCPVCNGDCVDPAIKKAYDAWEEFEPPNGDGWQLWETCSEGSPISPVFATAEELADWAADNATVFADCKTSRAKWLDMIKGEESTGALDCGSLGMSGPGHPIDAACNFEKTPE
jgi:hypothetical protein